MKAKCAECGYRGDMKEFQQPMTEQELNYGEWVQTSCPKCGSDELAEIRAIEPCMSQDEHPYL